MGSSPSTTFACLAILTLAAARTGVTAAEKELPLEFSGGHDIGRNDYGRPVLLIAAALGVKPDEFRGYDLRGLLFEKKGEKDKAIADYRRALSLQPRCRSRRPRGTAASD